jgi:hypothetical protein
MARSGATPSLPGPPNSLTSVFAPTGPITLAQGSALGSRTENDPALAPRIAPHKLPPPKSPRNSPTQSADKSKVKCEVDGKGMNGKGMERQV